ncbi:hypothetical protein E2C01_044121 [Portunus trituberculatus]|uniref:MADF domain-containing protein n=1 Tax=Portunus trituberculatus TaxID=210409 RepID=A0A5B7FXZ5_PORTR|nr:hypothetical protein [Portunus trituberculatus]
MGHASLPDLHLTCKGSTIAEKTKFQWCRNAEIDEKFLKKVYKRKIFEKITTELRDGFPALHDVTTEAVMHKWSMLKKSFSRELGKAKHPKSGSGYTSNWHLFQELLFLIDTASAGPSISNYEDQPMQDSGTATATNVSESMDEVLCDSDDLEYGGTDECDATPSPSSSSSSFSSETFPESSGKGAQDWSRRRAPIKQQGAHIADFKNSHESFDQVAQSYCKSLLWCYCSSHSGILFADGWLDSGSSQDLQKPTPGQASYTDFWIAFFVAILDSKVAVAHFLPSLFV